MRPETRPVIITGREPLDFTSLDEAIKWFWRTEGVDAVLLVPPELKFKAKELVDKMTKENPVSKCQFAVIYSFRSPTAWLLASKEILEFNYNE